MGKPALPALAVGMIVYCRRFEMPARVVGTEDLEVHLVRPSGMTWTSRRMHVRPASAWERRQYVALAKLLSERFSGRWVREDGLGPSGVPDGVLGDYLPGVEPIGVLG